jgi:hypothetical protein
MGSGNAFPFKQRRYKLLPEVEDASRSFPDLAPKLATYRSSVFVLKRCLCGKEVERAMSLRLCLSSQSHCQQNPAQAEPTRTNRK